MFGLSHAVVGHSGAGKEVSDDGRGSVFRGTLYNMDPREQGNLTKVLSRLYGNSTFAISLL